jgi:prefoldin subunit 5
MRLDSAVKDLQKEKQELESKLKNVNVALTALTKLTAKPDADSKVENNPATRPASQATAAKPAPAVQPANKPAGI